MARIEPALFPAFGLLVAAAMHLTLPIPAQPAGFAWQAGPLITLLGIGLVAWAIGEQFRAGTDPAVRTPTARLVVTGPYQFSRNPIYLGFLVAQAGIGFWTTWWLAVVLVPVVGTALSKWVIRGEEAHLWDTFPEFEAYAAKVRRWI